MKETGILFRGEDVRAILDGRKTQTRRIAKITDEWCKPGFVSPFTGHVPRRIEDHISYCPFGSVGDVIWARETWRIGAWNQSIGAIAVDYKADGFCRKEWLRIEDDFGGDKFEKYWIQTSDELQRKGVSVDANGHYSWPVGQSPCRWRPSISMPRWASRINLEITGVRVERLNEISEKDAWAEGCEGTDDDVTGGISGYAEYRQLWESMNGKGSWDKNPFCWVISFRRM